MSRSTRAAGLVLTLAAALAGAGTAVVDSATVASPKVEGPVTGGRGTPTLASTTFDLAVVGYSQQEYFLSGTATAYTSTGTPSSDGKWTVAPGSSAAYKTRLVVYRPLDAKKFNGTVVVEWLNVSGGRDAAADWINAHTVMVGEGFAWVGVSAQSVGVEGGRTILGDTSPSGLKSADPERYASLVHPGDSFSYDIFSQAGEAIRHHTGLNLLPGLKVARLLAAGDSQSAFRLVTYINAIHPIANVYDGFLVHSRGRGGAALSEAPQPAIAVPAPAHIRNDLRVPVLALETESDLISLGYFSDRQPDSERFRLWEVAGTAHADTYTVGVGATDTGHSPASADLVITPFACAKPINSGPQHFVLNAAVAALDRWVRRGSPPAVAPRLQAEAGPPPTLKRDARGNALGGIRTPQVDVPVATLSGLGQTGASFCFLFGTTAPFDAATLAALYPSHQAYVKAVDKAATAAVRAGFLLEPDARLIRAAAARSSIGK